MNERIKELAEQAGILKKQTVKAKIVKNEDGTWTSILEYPDLEKFAEVIAEECMDIIAQNKKYAKDHKWSSSELANVCVFEIEKTFGVKNGKETVFG